MSETIRILLVEDDEDDYIIVREMLSSLYGHGFALEWQRDYRSALAAVERDDHDVYLIDFMLGRHNGLDLVSDAEDRDTTAAIIVLTGQDRRQRDLIALSAGASDYLEKNSLTPEALDRAIRYAMERKRSERQLARLARQDALTGLANRAAFRSRLSSDMLHASRSGDSLGILLVDLDNFKDVNDTLGHPVGDQLLTRVAAQLKAVVRKTDLVARLGGDEFAIITSHVEDASDVTGITDKVLAAFREPVQIDAHGIQVTTSIGVAVYPRDGKDPDELLEHADLALYEAKEGGRNCFRLFDERLSTRVAARRATEAALRAALDEQGFHLRFQPQVELATGRIAAVEAHVHWRHPQRGLVPSEEFMSIAESSGLIVPLGERLLRMACEQAVRWQRAGLPAIPMAVRLSVLQLRCPGFPESLMAILGETGMDATRLQLELNENVIMDRSTRIAEALEAFRRRGVRLTVDDFGAGYLSLCYLKRSPCDALKLHRAFVRDIGTDPGEAAVTEALVRLGSAFGLGVIAQGVDTEGQARILNRQGCPLAQGSYLAPPMEAEQFAAFHRGRVAAGT